MRGRSSRRDNCVWASTVNNPLCSTKTERKKNGETVGETVRLLFIVIIISRRKFRDVMTYLRTRERVKVNRTSTRFCVEKNKTIGLPRVLRPSRLQR